MEEIFVNGFPLALLFLIKENVQANEPAGGSTVAEILDLQYYRDTGELKSPAQVEKDIVEAMPSLDEIATVMMMSSDELFIELLARVEYDESLRQDISTSTLIQELTNRALHMELLCEVATQLNE
jgi:hypothetical protein